MTEEMMADGWRRREKETSRSNAANPNHGQKMPEDREEGLFCHCDVGSKGESSLP